MSLTKPWVSPEIVDQIFHHGQVEDPKEACGVVLPDSRVVQLPNSSSSPTSSFVISEEDLVNVLNDYVAQSGVDPYELQREHFVIWHTHPSGIVGPSPGDLRERHSGFQYVVVTLPGGEAVQF